MGLKGRRKKGTIKDKSGMQHAAALVRFVKPIDMTWDDAGKLLRSLRSPLARAMNYSVLDLLVERRQGKQWNIGTRSYQLVDEHLKALAPDVHYPSAIILGCSEMVAKEYDTFLKGNGRGRPPGFSDPQPIYVTSSGHPWSIEKDGRGYILSIKLTRGRGERIRFAITASGKGMWMHLDRMTKSTSKQGDVKIGYDKVRRCWTARLSFSWPKPPQNEGAHTMSLHTGVARLLVGVSTDGGMNILDDGAEVREMKKRFTKRIGKLRRKMARSPGRGACGHGSERRIAALGRARDAESRWIKTHSEQLAAQVVKTCLKNGVGHLILEKGTPPKVDDEETIASLGEVVDWYIKLFPFHVVKLAVETAAVRVGVMVSHVPTFNISKRCPVCGEIGVCSADHENQWFACSCGFEDDLDVVACFNMLIAAKRENDVEEIIRKRVAARKVVEEAKKAKKDRLLEAAQRKWERGVAFSTVEANL